MNRSIILALALVLIVALAVDSVAAQWGYGGYGRRWGGGYGGGYGRRWGGGYGGGYGRRWGGGYGGGWGRRGYWG